MRQRSQDIASRVPDADPIGSGILCPSVAGILLTTLGTNSWWTAELQVQVKTLGGRVRRSSASTTSGYTENKIFHSGSRVVPRAPLGDGSVTTVSQASALDHAGDGDADLYEPIRCSTTLRVDDILDKLRHDDKDYHDEYRYHWQL